MNQDELNKKIESMSRAVTEVGDMAHFDAVNSEFTITEIFLQRQTIGSQYILPMEFVREMASAGNFDQLRVYLLDLTRELVVQVRKHIWAERLGTEEIEIPFTWWDHFKRDHFPKWLLKRFPPKYIKFSYQFDLLYPDIVADRQRSSYTVLRHIS